MPDRKTAEVDVDGRRLLLSNLGKVLYPATGFTKAQVIDYHARVADSYLRHLAGRPVSLVRCPDGVDAESFWEKNCPNHRPSWIRTAGIASDHGVVEYCLIDDKASLIWTANLAALELHTSLARADSIDTPTMVVFDLDPGEEAGLVDCARVALQIRVMCERLDLRVFVKSSGSKGLHLVVPLNVPTTYRETRGFAAAAAALLTRHNPEKVTDRMRKELRKGKVFVDWSQNSRHKTTVTAYSLRVQQRPTVSMPLAWEEVEAVVETGDTGPVLLEAPQVLERIGRLGDLWRRCQDLRQELPDLA